MLYTRLNNCPECNDIKALIRGIDCRLADLGNSLYNNISFMLNKPINYDNVNNLIFYKKILLRKYYNPCYLEEYSVGKISSKVISITSGCISKCNEPIPCVEEPCTIDIIPNPTTTTTSSSSSSTTTTTTTIN